MLIHISIYTYIHIYTYTFTYTSTFIYAHIHIYIHTHIYIYIHTSIHKYMYIYRHSTNLDISRSTFQRGLEHTTGVHRLPVESCACSGGAQKEDGRQQTANTTANDTITASIALGSSLKLWVQAFAQSTFRWGPSGGAFLEGRFSPFRP